MNIYQSITNIMQESIAISKDKVNKQQGFNYRGIDDVMNTFYPLLSKYKVFIVPNVIDQKRENRQTKNGSELIYSILKVEYTFFAEDGSCIKATTIGEGMDSGDKASNKAMAIAMKYAMFQVFCIPTEEMPDADSETPPPSKRLLTPIQEAHEYSVKTKSGKEIKLDSLEDDKLKQLAEDKTDSKMKEYAKLLLDERIDKNLEDLANNFDGSGE